MRVVKKKVSAPFKQCELDIVSAEGICREGDLLDLGADHGVIVKSGAWYTYQGEQLGNGRAKAIEALRVAPATCEAVRAEVWAKVALGSGADVGGHGGGLDPHENDGGSGPPRSVRPHRPR